jgi:hypothetical protein
MIDRDWKSDSTKEQLNTLNAAAGDLAAQIEWHGFKLSKDDWRHLISGTILGWRTLPAVDRGEGSPGWIMLGGSSLDLNKEQATDALTLAFSIGDDPESQGLKCAPVRWCKSVCGARWITDEQV